MANSNIEKQLNEIDVFARNMQQIQRTKQLMLQRYSFYVTGGGSTGAESGSKLAKKQTNKNLQFSLQKQVNDSNEELGNEMKMGQDNDN